MIAINEQLDFVMGIYGEGSLEDKLDEHMLS